MIELKAITVQKNGKLGVNVNGTFDGSVDEIINEGLSIIQSVTEEIRKESDKAYITLLAELITNPDILFGESDGKEGDKTNGDSSNCNG